MDEEKTRSEEMQGRPDDSPTDEAARQVMPEEAAAAQSSAEDATPPENDSSTPSEAAPMGAQPADQDAAHKEVRLEEALPDDAAGEPASETPKPESGATPTAAEAPGEAAESGPETLAAEQPTSEQPIAEQPGQMGEPPEGAAAAAAAEASGQPPGAAESEAPKAEVDDDDDDDEGDIYAKPIEEVVEEPEEDETEKDWYILKVQSNREASICDALQRRVKIEGLEHYFDEIIVPTEDVAEFKNGKRKVVKRKLYPGYIVVHMAINDDTWFLVRETPGIGDFTGAQGKPVPMQAHEVQRIRRLSQPEEEEQEQIKTAIPFKLNERVRIKEGTFENFEGEVEGIDETHGRVTVVINIFGRPTPVDLEHWQIESM